MKVKILFIFIILITVSCLNPVPRKPITRKTSSFIEESVAFNKKMNAKEESEIKRVIALDSIYTYKTSSKGFWYTYTKKSETVYTPKFGDELKFTYQIEDLYNNIIYSFNEVGEKSYVVDQQEIVEGLRNALKLMKENEEITFLFPSHRMYGYTGDENKIGSSQSLKVKVQLIKINKKNESN
ncbi:gliding motility-associated peptidyl-prolyl isomerase GldI [Lutibacter sp. TH_r2]|uniref:gliding motility-associated peptidyl-prolyl isomerase GldI n=1 Tax=Lutibacter sp. TH_r2 TaxID=3082083 RepID=UPI00295393F3|nr:gliding motility-associated peptidyl-prolyl isomerase GldI [Lutibacter sp. TH_r2]MDV7188172.1 gliding motility-associated peptidyl-prolyl isomerase GldI [Lutibacter sp. TH_r2]